MRDYTLVGNARELKDYGVSNTTIASKLSIPKAKVSRWCNTLSDSKKMTSQQKLRRYYFSVDQINVGKLNSSDARLYAALLYWCEGAKYPSDSRVIFTTSDVNMQMLFISLLRKGFALNESKFRAWMQIHTDHNTNDIITYWSKALNIPASQFLKPSITIKNGNRYRRSYMGTCAVRYHDYKILLRLIGIYTRFTQKALKLIV